MKPGIQIIAEERKRQIEVEGFDAEHDFDNRFEDIVRAALYYADCAIFANVFGGGESEIKLMKEGVSLRNAWPLNWDMKHCKPTGDAIRNLTKAGALIAAAIDKLQDEEAFKKYLEEHGE